MSFIQPFSNLYQSYPLFNQENRLSLSKQRIIQKNLVHFQGFPDSLYNENLLTSPEYLGQYGNIEKILLVSKEDKKTKQKINSAYVTFETDEQAAYCILSLDSIKINDQIVRAFFGTTKYCNHFLNNFHCFNKDKCIFLHHLADPLDIIDENRKFGYNDHIKLAKKIISFGSLQSKSYTENNNYINIKTNFPNIKTIYEKEKENDLFHKKSHKRQFSNLSNSSTANNSSNKINNRNLSESSSKEKDKKDNNNSNDNIKSEKNKNLYDFECFKSNKKSRFFDNINNEYQNYDNDKLNNLSFIVNNLCKRMAFFIYFKNNRQLKDMEINYCLNIYNKTNDNEIKLILENKF